MVERPPAVVEWAQGADLACWLPLVMARQLHHATECLGGAAVGGADEVRVGAKGSCGVGVAEAAGDRPDVDAGGKEARCCEVAEVVEADAFDLQLSAEPCERQRHAVRAPRLNATLVIGKHVRLRIELHAAELGPRLHRLAMASKHRHRSLVERDPARLVRLRRLLDDRVVGRLEDGTLDQKLCTLIIDIAPSEPAQLSASGARDHGEMQHHGELRVSTLRSACDQPPYIIRRWRVRGRLAQPRR